MSKLVRVIVTEAFSLNSERIVDLLMVWSASCPPLVKMKSAKYNSAPSIVSMLSLKLCESIIESVGIDLDRPFVRAAEVSQPLLDEIRDLKRKLRSNEIALESLKKTYSKLISLHESSCERMTILDSYGPSYGVNPMIQRMVSRLGVHLIPTYIHDQIVKGGCDENR
jgi:hypothetical protein